jgi:hypothetical protein
MEVMVLESLMLILRLCSADLITALIALVLFAIFCAENFSFLWNFHASQSRNKLRTLVRNKTQRLSDILEFLIICNDNIKPSNAAQAVQF